MTNATVSQASVGFEASPRPLIPAQAGIQGHLARVLNMWHWVPAFAGTNGKLRRRLLFREALVMLEEAGLTE